MASKTLLYQVFSYVLEFQIIRGGCEECQLTQIESFKRPSFLLETIYGVLNIYTYGYITRYFRNIGSSHETKLRANTFRISHQVFWNINLNMKYVFTIIAVWLSCVVTVLIKFQNILHNTHTHSTHVKISRGLCWDTFASHLMNLLVD